MQKNAEQAPEPPRPRSCWIARLSGIVAVIVLAGGVGLGAERCARARASPAAREEVLRPTPSIVAAVRDLARLETVEFHMERVIDLSDRQERLFGLVEVEDAILLVASADVVAGVDLAELREGDVVVDAKAGAVTITLPRPIILSTRIDSDRTYVHTRRTDVLARRHENLETRARQEAERSLEAAAVEAGILGRARSGAARTVEMLIRSLGYARTEILWQRE